MAAPEELVRVTAGRDGSLRVGRTAPGRGAWLCAASPACLEAAVERRAFDRALRSPVSPGSVEALRGELANHARIDVTRDVRDVHDVRKD